MAVDKFLGVAFSRWFDGNDHTWTSIIGLGTSGVWNCGAPIEVDTILIKWHYGGAFNQDGGPGSVSGAAADFVLEGSANGSTGWTAVVTDADPVGTAGASYPEDFENEYTFATETFQYWRWRNTTSSNNDVYTISALGPAAPVTGVVIDLDEDGFDEGEFDQIPLAHIGKWVIRRGASPEVVGGASVGSLVLTLVNPQDDDRYNPLNTSSPLYPSLRDGIPIWIGVNSDGALFGPDPRGLFGGRITDITPLPQGGATRSPFVIIEAEDCLGWFKRVPVRVNDAIGRSYRELREDLLDEANETRIDLANEILTMPLSSWDGSLLDGLEAINKVNGTRHYCDPADLFTDWYAYTTRNRQWRLDATVDGSFDAGDDHVTQTNGWTLSADTVTNQQKATVEPIYFTPSSTVVWRAQGILPAVVTSAADKVIWVEFDDFVDSPAASIQRTGTAPTVTLEAFGKTAKLTIASAGTTTVTGILIAGRLVKRGNAESVVIDDTASQAGARGIRSGSEISGDFVGVMANAEGIAQHIVWRYANPQFRPTVTVENWLPYQFEIDLYDIVSVTVTELQMTERLFEVVGLTHEAIWAHAGDEMGHLHTTTYVLQECKVQEDPGWFTLDVSELDGTDILAYQEPTMAYTTPPTFVASDVLEADQLNVLSDDIEYLYGQGLGFVLSCIQAARSTNQAIATATGEYVNFTSENIDVGGWFPGSGTTITTPSGAIPPAATTVAVSLYATATFATNGTGIRRIRFHKNGSSIGGQQVAAISGDTTTVYCNELTTVAATDTIKVEVYQNSGGPINVTDAKVTLFRIGVAS